MACLFAFWNAKKWLPVSSLTLDALGRGFHGVLCFCRVEKKERKDGEVDEKFWELLLSADKKDYERICVEYGVTDFRGMLKKLNEKKREIEEQQSKVDFK